MGGKFSDAMKAAKAVRLVEDEPLETVNTDLQISVNTDICKSNDPFVSLTIKVPKTLRQHWQVEAKKAGTTVTQEVINALSNKFGKP